MYCEFCLKAGEDKAGKTDFLTGMNHLKKESEKHGESRRHKNACDFIAKRVPEETLLAHTESRTCEKTVEKEFRELKMKFSAAYMTVFEELPFTKFTSQILLMNKNGLDVLKTYDDDTACAEFTGCTADKIKGQIMKEALRLIMSL